MYIQINEYLPEVRGGEMFIKTLADNTNPMVTYAHLIL